jgi:LuxR family maltose regulon positive regulatory protein
MIRPVRPDGSIDTGGAFVPIIRRRVIDRLASAAMQRVVLLVAPAGYGKSVALRQFLDLTDSPAVRFDVLPDHATLLGFLRGFADALADVAPDARTTLAGAHEKNATSASPGNDLALWMHSHLKSYRGIIAIDDLHVAQDDREVTRFLSSLIDRTKGRVQWIIASRSTLGLPIGTWLAYGDSDLAVDEHDLKFSVEEARDAARAFKLAVRDEELYELLNLTEGWATAMTFALRSSTRSVDLRNVASMTREMIYRYLAEQVYATLSEDERGFIETAALLREIDLDVLARAGFDNGAALVEELRQRAAFLHETTPGVFRMHDLFADFVLHELLKRGSSAAAERARAIGAILESTGRTVPALRLYVWASAAPDVLRVIEERGVELVAQGFADDVSAALEFLSTSRIERSAAVEGVAGLIAITRGRFEDGERLLQRALKGNMPPAQRAELLMRLAICQSNRGNEPIALLEDFVAEPGLQQSYLLEAESYLAYAYAKAGRGDDADATAARVASRLGTLDDGIARSRVLLRLGNVALLRARGSECKELLTRAANEAAQCALWSTASRAFYSLAHQALMLENDTASGLWCAQQASAAATRAGDYLDLQMSLLMMLTVETRRGNVDRVLQVERQLLELNKSDSSTANYIVSSQAHRCAWSGRFADAHRMFGSIAGRQPHAPDRAFIRAVLALCLALDGQSKKSVEACEAALDGNEPCEMRSVLFEFATTFVALAETLNGRFTVASRLLKKVKSIHPAVDAFAAGVSELMSAAKNASFDASDVPAIADSVATFGYGGYARYLTLAHEALEERRQPEEHISLTPSELAILRALAEGHAPKEIAAEMGRSVLTVQTHIQNVIRKFGGHGRSDAIAAARRMGLL